jgi:hypothetical protein
MEVMDMKVGLTPLKFGMSDTVQGLKRTTKNLPSVFLNEFDMVVKLARNRDSMLCRERMGSSERQQQLATDRNNG